MMFPQFKKNESGIALFIVLMVAIIIMILSVGILTQSMNEVNYGQQQVDQIVSDQLAKGLFWNQYSSAFASGNITNMQNISYSFTNMAGRTYNVSVNYQATGQVSGCPNCTTWNSTANYDTFN